MKLAHLLSIVGVLAFGVGLARAATPDNSADFAGTYVASLPERAEILQIHRDGTAEITLSDQVTAGAGGFTFSDSLGSWKVVGPRKLKARFLNLNFDVTGPAATFSGTAVVDYTFQFEPTLRKMRASCNGKIFPTGQDPLDPNSTPVAAFDCSYLNGYFYQRVPLE